MLGYYLFVLVVFSTFTPQIPAWETPSPHQYHIQTDEGPERYFRYQTDSGQYRKEKRLEDGTVVGTYAWIDADGILRQRDYIADNAGYRILKNKNVFVGRNINVGDAVKSAKKYPTGAGTLDKTGFQHQRPVITIPYQGHISSNNYIPRTSSPLSQNYIPSSTPSSVPQSYNYIPSSSPSPVPQSYNYIPSSTASPNLQNYDYIPSSTPSPIPQSYNYIPSTTAAPSVTSSYSPSLSYIPSTTPSSVPSSSYIPSTTLSPVSTLSPTVDVSHNSIDSSTPFRIIIPTENSVVEITPNAFSRSPYEKIQLAPLHNLTYVSSNNLQSTVNPYIETTQAPYYDRTSSLTTLAPPVYSPSYNPADFGGSQEVDHNSLDYNPYVRHVENSYRFQNGPTYPLDKNGRPYLGNQPKAQTYDGVSVSNDGFRYYIPRAYHEEETLPGDKRSGSFGYIDPFGIRRVIYYNTAPGSGFQHRKNNRYVGFNAPPYDPRPY